MRLLRAACKGFYFIGQVKIPYQQKPSKFDMKVDRGLVWLMIQKDPEDEETFFEEIEAAIKNQTRQIEIGGVRKRCLELLDLFKNHVRSGMTEELLVEKKRRKRGQKPVKIELKDYHFYQAFERIQELAEKDYNYKTYRLELEAEKNGEKIRKTNRLNKFEFAEYKSLLSTGFQDWTLKEVKAFLRATKSSRKLKDYEKLAKEFPDRYVKDVKKYCDVFWERFHELKDEKIRESAGKIFFDFQKKKQRFFERVKGLLEGCEEVAYDPEGLQIDEDFSRELDQALLVQLKSIDLTGDVFKIYDGILDEVKKIGKLGDLTVDDIEHRCEKIIKSIARQKKTDTSLDKSQESESDFSEHSKKSKRSEDSDNEPLIVRKKKQKINNENVSSNRKRSASDEPETPPPKPKKFKIELRKDHEMEVDGETALIFS